MTFLGGDTDLRLGGGTGTGEVVPALFADAYTLSGIALGLAGAFLADNEVAGVALGALVAPIDGRAALLAGAGGLNGAFGAGGDGVVLGLKGGEGEEGV